MQHKASKTALPNKRAARNRRPQVVGKSCLFSGDLPRWVERAGIVDLRNLMIGKAENLPQDLVGMFAEQRRARYFGRAVRHLDGIANREVFAALRMIYFDHRAGGAQRWILDQLLHR